MHDSALQIDLSQVNGSAFVTVEGDIDVLSVDELSAVLESLDPDKQIVIDMSGVRFMDSTGINALIGHALRTKGTGGSVCIDKPSRSVQRLVELTGLASLFYKSQSDCCQPASGA